MTAAELTNPRPVFPGAPRPTRLPASTPLPLHYEAVILA